METRIRRLFSRRSTPRDKDQQVLKALPYEHMIALREPVKGTNRVFGNGPNVLQKGKSVRIIPRPPPAPVSEAPAPSIPLIGGGSYSNSKRPRTAPHSGSSQLQVRGGRIQVSLPANLHQDSSKRGSPEPQQQPQPKSSHRKLRRNSSLQLEYSFGGSDSASQQSKSVTGYVDLLDAAATINPSRSLKQRARASGVRDYGEDVADRNIAEFGAVDLNSPQFSYLRAIYVQDKYCLDGEVENKTDGKSHTRNSSAWDLTCGSSNGSGGGYENTAEREKRRSQSQPPVKAKSVHSHTESLRTTAPLPSTPIATANTSAPSPSPSTTNMSLRGRRENSVTNSTSKRPHSYIPPPVSSAQQSPTDRPQRRSSVTSTKSYTIPRGEDSLSLTEVKSSGTLSRTSSVGSNHRGPREKQIVNALSPGSSLPTSSRYTQTLPVPPLSPIVDSSPSDAARTSSDRNRPALRRRSRGFSANYTAFPSQSPRKLGTASTSSTLTPEKRNTPIQNDQEKAASATPENGKDPRRISYTFRFQTLTPRQFPMYIVVLFLFNPVRNLVKVVRTNADQLSTTRTVTRLRS
jgi:hypothetical protein